MLCSFNTWLNDYTLLNDYALLYYYALLYDYTLLYDYALLYDYVRFLPITGRQRSDCPSDWSLPCLCFWWCLLLLANISVF